MPYKVNYPIKIDDLPQRSFKIDKSMSAIVGKDTLSESEVLLIKQRLNNKKTTPDEVFGQAGTFKLTPEQTKKGYDWLMNQWKTPKGVERKNNPFGDREQKVLDNFKEFKLIDFLNHVSPPQAQMGINNYLPIYRVKAKDGSSFDYYNDYQGIHIVG